MLRAAQVRIEDGIGEPILIGRPAGRRGARSKRFGLRIRPGVDFELINPRGRQRYPRLCRSDAGKDRPARHHAGSGHAPSCAPTRRSIGALAVKRGDADAMLCGLDGRFLRHLQYVEMIIGKAAGVLSLSGLSMLINQQGVWFMTDTFVSDTPTAREIAETTILAAAAVTRFGLTPRAALLSASDFGSRNDESARRMREAVGILHRGGSRARSRWRNARRHRPVGDDPPAGIPQFDACTAKPICWSFRTLMQPTSP